MRRFFSSPKARLAAINKEIQSYAEITKIKVQQSENSVIVYTKPKANFSTLEVVKRMHNTRRLGEWVVQVIPAYREKVYPGVILGVHPDIDIDYIINGLDELNIKYRNVLRMNGYKADGNKIKTNKVKVDFLEPLKDRIQIDYQTYKIREFVQKPARCFKCQKYGHISTHCKSKNFNCIKYAGNHPINECQENNEIKCVNCNGKHISTDKRCPRYQLAVEVNNESKTKKISYAEAAKNVNDKIKDGKMKIPEQVNEPKMRFPYLNLKKGTENESDLEKNPSNENKTETKKSEVQPVPTIEIKEKKCPCESINFETITNCILQIVEMILHRTLQSPQTNKKEAKKQEDRIKTAVKSLLKGAFEEAKKDCPQVDDSKKDCPQVDISKTDQPKTVMKKLNLHNE